MQVAFVSEPLQDEAGVEPARLASAGACCLLSRRGRPPVAKKERHKTLLSLALDLCNAELVTTTIQVQH